MVYVPRTSSIEPTIFLGASGVAIDSGDRNGPDTPAKTFNIENLGGMDYRQTCYIASLHIFFVAGQMEWTDGQTTIECLIIRIIRSPDNEEMGFRFLS